MERIVQYEGVRNALAMLPNSIGISRYLYQIVK